jgi:hypothetical protein
MGQEQQDPFVIISRASVNQRDRAEFRALLPRLRAVADSEPGS